MIRTGKACLTNLGRHARQGRRSAGALRNSALGAPGKLRPGLLASFRCAPLESRPCRLVRQACQHGLALSVDQFPLPDRDPEPERRIGAKIG